MYVIRDKIKYRAKVRTKSQSGNTGFTDGLPFFLAEIEYATLHVPESSIDLYKATSPWKNFKNIVAIKDEDTAIESVMSDKSENEYFMLNGQQSSYNNRGIMIVKSKNGRTKKIIVK